MNWTVFTSGVIFMLNGLLLLGIHGVPWPIGAMNMAMGAVLVLYSAVRRRRTP